MVWGGKGGAERKKLKVSGRRVRGRVLGEKEPRREEPEPGGARELVGEPGRALGAWGSLAEPGVYV